MRRKYLVHGSDAGLPLEHRLVRVFVREAQSRQTPRPVLLPPQRAELRPGVVVVVGSRRDGVRLVVLDVRVRDDVVMFDGVVVVVREDAALRGGRVDGSHERVVLLREGDRRARRVLEVEYLRPTTRSQPYEHRYC